MGDHESGTSPPSTQDCLDVGKNKTTDSFQQGLRSLRSGGFRVAAKAQEMAIPSVYLVGAYETMSKTGRQEETRVTR